MTYPAPEVQPAAPYSTPASEPRLWKPVLTRTLMGITIVIYLLQMLTNFLYGVDYPAALGMKVNDLIIQGQLWRLITPVFLHGSILHISFNMYALFALGSGMERFFGRKRFIALYFLAGFAGNVASFMLSQAASLGASTAVFGLLAAQGVFLYQNKELFGSVARREITNVVTIALINLFIGLSPGIDNWGHLGGLVGGALFAWFAGPNYQPQYMGLTGRIVDQRTSGEMIRAGIFVLILFSMLAGYKIVTSM
jgi:rhomboid protease GluP